jgi:hypothetical protein
VGEKVGEAARLLPAAEAADLVPEAGRLGKAAPGEVPVARVADPDSIGQWIRIQEGENDPQK